MQSNVLTNFVTYKNGNYQVLFNIKNGTKIRFNNEDCLMPDRPESIDVKISNKCSHGCNFCHEASCITGSIADLETVKNFALTLPPYIEIAVGGGNLMEDIDHTTKCLKIFKENKAFPSITIHQKDFVKYNDIIKKWKEKELIYGIGISLHNIYDEKFWHLYYQYPTAVLHTIVGILSPEEITYLSNLFNIKILLLGYKKIRRGQSFFKNNKTDVEHKIAYLKNNIINLLSSNIEIVSFDNLALEQLDIKNIISKDTWNTYYMGDDGITTFYVDLVSMQYAQSSTSNIRYLIEDNNANIMFENIRKQKDNG